MFLEWSTRELQGALGQFGSTHTITEIGMMLAEHLVQRIARRIFRPDRLQPPFQDLLLLQALAPAARALRACSTRLRTGSADPACIAESKEEDAATHSRNTITPPHRRTRTMSPPGTRRKSQLIQASSGTDNRRASYLITRIIR